MKNYLLKKLKRYHRGYLRAIGGKELEVAFSVSGSQIRKMINALRSDGEPICSDENGYYYASNAQEVHLSINRFNSRIGKMDMAKQGLVKSLEHFKEV